MSEPTVTRIESDRYTKVVASSVEKSFLSKDFLMTMRFSSLYKDEEFDNALAYSTWHFLLETGIAQMKDYVASLEILVREKYLEIPLEQLFRIDDLIGRFRMYDDSKAVDTPENIKIIRNYLRAYNTNLGYGIVMYDMHSSLLNGRYAENGGQGRKDIKEITKTILQRDYEIALGDRSRDDRGTIDKITGFLGRHK